LKKQTFPRLFLPIWLYRIAFPPLLRRKAVRYWVWDLFKLGGFWNRSHKARTP